MEIWGKKWVKIFNFSSIKEIVLNKAKKKGKNFKAREFLNKNTSVSIKSSVKVLKFQGNK